jgi:hypothetical protein
MLDFLVIFSVLEAIAIFALAAFLVKLSSFAVEIADRLKQIEAIPERMDRLEDDTALVSPILQRIEASGLLQGSLSDVPKAGSYDPTRFKALPEN